MRFPSGRLAAMVSACVLMLGLLLPIANAEDDPPHIAPVFAVVSAESHIVENVVRLDAAFDLVFSEKLLEALHNGVPLTILVEIEVSRERSYWVSESIAEIEQRFQISYNPITGRYLFHNLNSDAQFQLPNFEAARVVLSHLGNFPLLDISLLEPEQKYSGRIRVRVDDENFPVPLRLMSYVTSDWDLESEWFEWSLH